MYQFPRILIKAMIGAWLFPCTLVLAQQVSVTNQLPSKDAAPNLFTPPAQEQGETPTFTQGKEGAGLRRKMLLGGQKDGVADWQQVKMIPSLSGQQRKQIHDLYKHAREKSKPLTEELKSIRQKYGENKPAAMRDPQTRQKFQQLRNQLVTLRQQTWSAVKGQLSDQQMQELELMRKGELKPDSQAAGGSPQGSYMMPEATQ